MLLLRPLQIDIFSCESHAKMDKICIFTLLTTLLKENMASMSLEMGQQLEGNQGLSSRYNEYQTVSKDKKVNISAEPLSCFDCNSIVDGEDCYKLGQNNSLVDYSHMAKKCPAEKPFCKVYRVEFLVLEDFESTDTGPYTPWSMERSCSDECKNFCVTMGGRTRITYCTSCCNSNLCNIDNAQDSIRVSQILFALFVTVFVLAE